MKLNIIEHQALLAFREPKLHLQFNSSHKNRLLVRCLLETAFSILQSSLLHASPSSRFSTKMAANANLPIINQDTTQHCTAISALCPVDQTTYGYFPSLGANAFFCALFALCCIANVVQGIRFKTWTYMIALGLGSLAEAIGMSLSYLFV